MFIKSERTLSLNSCWTILSIVTILITAPIAAGSSAYAATFSFTQIDVPGAFFTEAFGINDAGQIVGSFSDGTSFHGFLGTGGSFTQIDVPGAIETQAFGINDAGQIVGYFFVPTDQVPVTGRFHGFLDTGGSFTQIDVPGATDTEAFGINDAGQIVGRGDQHGFLDAGGNFTKIDFTQIGVPGITFTEARDINDAGQIVGYSENRAPHSPFPFHSFLDIGGSFTQIDVPGATDTEAFGINDAGQIVGIFFDDTGTHGFLATPIAERVPEPSTLTLLGVGIGLTVLCTMRRRAISSKPL